MSRTRENSTVVFVSKFEAYTNLVVDEYALDIVNWINANTVGDVELKSPDWMEGGLDVYFELPEDATHFALRWVS